MTQATERERRSAARRQQILASTLAIFGESGLSETTIAAIAARSGASVGSIYHHFGDREGILYALYRESFDHCFEALLGAVRPQTSARAGVFALVTTYLSWIAAHPARGRLMYEASEGAVLTQYETPIRAFKQAFYGEMMGWMAPFIDAGALVKLPPWAYDVIIMGPAHEFARRWLAGMREMALADAQEIIADAVWRAIQPAAAEQ